MPGSENLRICVTCGTQYDATIDEPLDTCAMCEDPRQYVPPTGHTFTTLARMRGKYENQIMQDDVDKRIWSIWTEPAFAIGERAVLIETDHGNILWDCIANLDQKTVDFINSKGGLKAMVVSHPHFYTSHLDWANEFDCPVYLNREDEEWLKREDKFSRRKFVDDAEEIIPGVSAVKLGGHFPGSMILHWNGHIFTADTIAVTLSGLYRHNRSPDANSFSMMWAYPNFIPLSPDVLHLMWQRMLPYQFHSVHSLSVGRDIRDPKAKSELLHDMKLQLKHQGHTKHALLEERWEGEYSEGLDLDTVGRTDARNLKKLEVAF